MLTPVHAPGGARNSPYGEESFVGEEMNRARAFLSRPPHCEPPLRGQHTPAASPCRTVIRTVRRSPHDGRSAATIGRATEPDAGAHRFAERALRLVLEVLDHRRTPNQLRAVLDQAVIDTLRSVSATPVPSRSLGAALLGPVRIQRINDSNIEVFGTYTRGPRVFALAGRLSPDGRGGGWRVSSLQVG